MKYIFWLTLSFLTLISCQDSKVQTQKKATDKPEIITSNVPQLDLEAANKLIELPLKCVTNPLPYKSGHVLAQESDLAMPIEHHPIFYGCFDWHSAVHGHWSMIYLMKTFPELDKAEEVRKIMNQHFTASNIEQEIAYFSLNKYTKSFERTYGWAWLLVLADELKSWEDPDAQRWFNTLLPLTQLISEKYIDYLPKLAYPIRVGEHSNTAFGLSFAYDYAIGCGDTALKNSIEQKAKTAYSNDASCPMSWEPSGYDFLSPCLQEMDLMRKVLSKDDFLVWLDGFFPNYASDGFDLEPAIIKDRSDGKLVHLDGLNFSRAWCLYPLSSVIKDNRFRPLADEHLAYSLGKMVDGDYSGEHWLASFALYAYKMRRKHS